MTKSRTVVSWWILLVGFFAAGLVLVIFFSQSFETASTLANLLTADGRADSFTFAFYERWSPALRLVGLAYLVLAFGLVIARRLILGWIEWGLAWLAKCCERLAQDGGALLSEIHLDWLECLLVLGITGVAAAGIFPLLWRPMGHDEAYTFVVFAQQPLHLALADYHLPNNHIFHTFWLHLSYKLFGVAPWVVRLPAFLAGLGLIPASFGVGKRLYGRLAGLLAAAFVASSSEVLWYSSIARGYTLLALLALLLFLTSLYVKDHRNSAAWAVWGVLAALGFYTIPVFLYPLGILAAWLFISMLFGDVGGYRSRLQFTLWLVASGLLGGFLTLLLYLPVFLHHRTTAVLFGNVFLESMSWNDFLQTAPIRLAETWAGWTGDVPTVVSSIVVASLLISIIFHRRISTVRVHPLLSGMAWLIPLVLYQRQQLWAKTWFFLLPMVLVWSAGGLVGVIDFLRSRLTRRAWPLAAVVVFAASLALVGGFWQRYGQWAAASQPAALEEMTIALKQRLAEGDVLAVSDPDDAPVWYYLELHQVPMKVVEVQREAFRRIFILVNRSDQQTIESVLKKRGIELSQVNIAQAELVLSLAQYTLYLATGK